MKKSILNSLPTNARIALIILLVAVVICGWCGKKIKDRFWGASEPAVTQQAPNNQKQNPSAPPASSEEAQKIYLALGNPSNAGGDANNYLLVNNYYALSYSRDRGEPNWVSWRISKGELGDLPRPQPDPFRPDSRIPKDWKPVTPSDYTGSGFDRGHMCPSADRSGSVEGMSETFLMSNMVPQTGDLNQDVWARLEGYLRTLVTRGSDVYIVAGPYGDKGKLKNKVTIPTNTWKIAIVVPAGAPVSAIDEDTRVIAVDMPNVKGIRNTDWQKYRTTVRDIERKTGYNFLSALPQNLQDALENKKDTIDD
ncbi:MAG TPA: DNA/RNA non-specific endonuclease [Pyrinomonadaceae bacterium]|jgi:endonuclease G